MSLISRGRRVEVRSRFDGSWIAGFEVAEVVKGESEVGYRLLRLSDRFVLPSLFRPREVRVLRDPTHPSMQVHRVQLGTPRKVS